MPETKSKPTGNEGSPRKPQQQQAQAQPSGESRSAEANANANANAQRRPVKVNYLYAAVQSLSVMVVLAAVLFLPSVIEMPSVIKDLRVLTSLDVLRAPLRPPPPSSPNAHNAAAQGQEGQWAPTSFSSPSSQAINISHSYDYDLPTAVFVGGTSGIGQAMVKSFAYQVSSTASSAPQQQQQQQQQWRPSRIVIVGRNATAAAEFFASLPQPPSAELRPHETHFVFCDAFLMRNVHAASAAVLDVLSTGGGGKGKINFLVLTPGIMSMQDRTETEEGIDRKLALHYYARWGFIYNFLPALRAARDRNEEAKVLSVMGGGIGIPITDQLERDDLAMKDSYDLQKFTFYVATYTDLMMTQLSSNPLNSQISFVHAHPGTVRGTNLIKRSDYWLLQTFLPVVEWFFSLPFISSSPEECAAAMWTGVHASARGAFERRGSAGEDVGTGDVFGAEEERGRLWAHTVEEVLLKRGVVPRVEV